MFIVICTVIVTLTISLFVFNLKPAGKRVEFDIKSIGSLESPTVKRSISQLLGPPLIDGNKVTSLKNGDEIFPSMLEAINSARRSITFETFIYWSGDIGKKFAEALSQKAKKGVRVYVILDWVGSRKFEESALLEMRHAGVKIERYRPPKWYNLTRFNNRTHRKILVVDGAIGFTGGVGIADMWEGNAQDSDHWREMHFKVEGPVVAQLQAAFLDNWNRTDPEVLHGDDFFPKLDPAGEILAQVFKSSPEEGSGSVRLMYLYSIVHAQKTIRIANAYFVPDSHFQKVLIEASGRGVKIDIIVPGIHVDTEITRSASRSVWGELLKAGIHIHEYTPTMFHCKYMVIDDVWISVGSTNLDNRSFRLNDECNLNGINSEWGLSLSKIFEDDLKHSRQVTLESWRKRPLFEKCLDAFSSLFKSQV